MTLKSAILKYLVYLEMRECSSETIRGYRILLNEFELIMNQQHGTEVYSDRIIAEDIEYFLYYRKMKGDQPSSRNRHYYILRGFFQHLVLREIIQKNPAMKIDPIRLHQIERPYLTMEEISKLIMGIKNDTIKVAVTTLAYTGLRVNELCRLKKYEVDLSTKLIYIKSGKGNKDRFVPITDRLSLILEEYLGDVENRKPSEYFFSTNRHHSISPDYINKCIKIASEEIGLSFKPTAHILRHSFASALVSRNAPLPSVQKILGHADLRITSRYIHQNMNALKEAVNLLP